MDALDDDFYGVSNRECILTLDIFFGRDDAFGFVTEIDEDASLGNPDYFAFDQIAGVVYRLLLFELLEDGAEINLAALLIRDLFDRRCGRLCDPSRFCSLRC